MDVKQTLEDRNKSHGNYVDVAIEAQALKKVIHNRPSWRDLDCAMQESLDMICTKIARIVHGDPMNPDHWHDIAGYATLIERYLQDD